MIRLERQDIGIGGLIGGIVNGMLVRYPVSIEKSIYATIEPFSYRVKINWFTFSSRNRLEIMVILS